MNLDSLISALQSTECAPASIITAEPDTPDSKFLLEVERIYTDHLPRVYPGWESRPQQLSMAHAVARAIYSEKCCMAEAGTGAGKALALLGPAVLYARHTGKPVKISTGTHVLQEQYLRKDVPTLQKAIGNFSVAIAKGKGNYLCLKRLNEESDLFGSFDEIAAWADQTQTGDRAELSEFDPRTWARVCADDSCTKSRCPFFQECHLFRAKRKMEEAQVIICNHALLIADITVQHLTYGMGSLLPASCATILDEAHHLESAARQGLGATLTQTRLVRILRELKNKAPLIDAAACYQANDALFEAALKAIGPEDRTEIGLLDVGDLQHAILAIKSAAGSERKRAPSDQVAEDLKSLEGRLDAYSEDLDGIATPGESRVVWAEVDRTGEQPRVSIHASPVEVSGLLRHELFDVPTVCSSATLTTNQEFGYFAASVGMPEGSHEFVCDSPFDYRRNALLYVPQDLPDPKRLDFHKAIAKDLDALLRVTKGRAFVLCTSWQGVNELHERLRRLPFRVLKQGEMARGRLMDTFTQDIHSVLIGTSSFWEGVDCPGDTLSLVAITRLPFSVPSDPITKAKVRAIEARGGNAFMHYSVPEAVLKLRQGFGRLIRTQSDRGVVAIFDKRIVEAKYGRQFRNSLPDAPLVRRLADVQKFFEKECVA